MSQVFIDDYRIGKETKLSKRYLGKIMYSRLIDFGPLPGANSEKSRSLGPSLDQLRKWQLAEFT